MEHKLIKLESLSDTVKNLHIGENSIELDFLDKKSKLSLANGKYSVKNLNGELTYYRYDDPAISSSVKNSIFNRITELTREILNLLEIAQTSGKFNSLDSVTTIISEKLTSSTSPDVIVYSFDSFVYKLKDYIQEVFFKDGKTAKFVGDKFLYCMVLLVADLEETKKQILSLI